MKKKILISLAVLLIIVTAASVFSLSRMSLGISTGTALVTDNGTLMLIKDNSPINLNFDTGKAPAEDKFSTGDKILVFHNGINESYPASTLCYMCINVGKGAKEEIPENVITSLKELGWLKKDIITQVPSEELCDFTEVYFDAGHILSENEALPDFPVLNVLHTPEELDYFINDSKSFMEFSEEALREFSSYTRDFFSEKYLVSALFYEGSSSYTHNVSKLIKSDENTLTVVIDKLIPETATCDMALRFLLVEVNISDIAGRDIKLQLSGSRKTAEMQKDYLNFSVSLPDGWDYEKHEGIQTDSISLDIYKSDDRENYLTITAGGFFGVCGTGLKTKEITLGKHTADMGIYDNNPDWDFIVLKGTPGSYCIYNFTDDMWWKNHGDEAMEILASLDVAKGIVSEKQAVTIAEKPVGEYNTVRTAFDTEKGIWTITFSKEETEAVVLINHDGEHLPTVEINE